MNREIRVAIVGMIFGILATIATEEMKCILLPFTSNCLRCWDKLLSSVNQDLLLHIFTGIYSILGVILLSTLLIAFITIDPEEGLNPNEPLYARVFLSIFGFLMLPIFLLIMVIYAFEKCL